MAIERNPNDPVRSPNDPYRAKFADDDIRRQTRLDNDSPMDPELAKGPASSGKIAMFAIAAAVVLGVVFYGLNNSTTNHAGASSTAQNTTQFSPPAAPPGMRDVSPRRSNIDKGVTTGAVPPSPQTPPAAAPAGNPPANTTPSR
jgi:hypothetical protein